MLSLMIIDKLASGVNVKRVAVENFLLTLSGDSYADSVNLARDSLLYKWSLETVKAIREGIRLNETITEARRCIKEMIGV